MPTKITSVNCDRASDPLTQKQAQVRERTGLGSNTWLGEADCTLKARQAVLRWWRRLCGSAPPLGLLGWFQGARGRLGGAVQLCFLSCHRVQALAVRALGCCAAHALLRLYCGHCMVKATVMISGTAQQHELPQWAGDRPAEGGCGSFVKLLCQAYRCLNFH